MATFVPAAVPDGTATTPSWRAPSQSQCACTVTNGAPIVCAVTGGAGVSTTARADEITVGESAGSAAFHTSTPTKTGRRAAAATVRTNHLRSRTS
jgi:hypothetical protein